MANIHPSSVIDPSAEFGQNVDIGPLCYIGPNVSIGDNTRLISHVCVWKNTSIGKDNIIWPHATLGCDPQDLKYKNEPTTLTIGDRNQIRESATIHRGTGHGGGITTVGSDNMFMGSSHIAHDCHIADHVLLANNVLLAGHIRVEDHVSMLGASAAHHYITIGCFAYISGMARLSHDVPPYMIVQGYDARVRALNIIGLERNGFEPATIERLKDTYRWLYRNNRVNSQEAGVANIADAIDTVENLYGDDPHVRHLIESLQKTLSGKAGRGQEASRTDNPRTNPTQ